MKITRILIAAAAAATLAFGLFGCANQEQATEPEVPQQEAPAPEAQPAPEPEPEPEPEVIDLSSYSWEELSQISAELASAADQDSAVDIALEYGLFNGTKPITLADGTKTSVQVIGVAHDNKTDGGKAGITFILNTALSEHVMNSTETNKGGWAKSEMRAYLEEQVSNLPADLQQVIVPVDKKTNNTGKSKTVSSVTTTSDRLWLLSPIEVSGEDVDLHVGSAIDPNIGFNIAKIFNEEGSQYLLFETLDQYDGDRRYKFFRSFADKDWWLRSPCSDSNDTFKLARSSGADMQADADSHFAAVPCFCI